MDIIHLVENMSQDMYLRLKHAAETGKWPEGIAVDEEQRASALQIVMAYQAKRLNSDDILSIGADGEIVTKSKRELKQEFASNNDNNIARFSDL